MKKPTNLRLILIALIFFQSYFVISQNLKPFTPRFDKRLKGDMLLIGNNILNRETNNRSPKDAYNGTGFNSDFNMKYIDVDNDNTTFSSSSATLTVPKPACYKIVYAGLYWGAILQQNDRTGIEKVKLKLPTGGYNDITGQIIHDANAAPIGNDNNKAYACYADITSLVAGQTNAQGLYTVANVKSSEGTNGGTGLSAGWSIFVVYEDPTLPAKFITSFDGFSGIGGATTLDIPVSGFKTIPTGPVRVKFAFAALEGDQPIAGDYLEINGTRIAATNAANDIIRPLDNFFNSSVTYVDPATDKTENFTTRNPNSTNTLGYDAGILNINNPGTILRPGGIVIDNNETSAKIRLGSIQDVYFYYFNAFAVDIIEPHIVLTKIVKNSAGVDIGNQDVTLGQQLNYEIGFKNTGNDDAKGLTIRDQLPINIIFNYPTDINPLPAGVTIQSYNPATRSIVFKIDDSVVKANTLSDKVISFKVKVVPDCNSLSEACSNSIDNSAYATYKGTLNPDFQISDDPSVNTNTGCILTPKATNFLVGVDGCKYTATATLCKEDVDLVAANGYTSYTWYSDEARTKQIGTGQILKVKDPGVYYVYNLAAAPCRSIYQAFTVTRFGTTTTNPVLPYAKAPYKGEVLICPNNGKELPNLFLCGTNDSRLIETHISDGSTLVWEKLDETSCAAPISASCANEGTSCSWTQVATGPNYEAKIAGQYRLTLNYAGGCFNRFYFNVFTNSLNPTEKHTDIICGKPGTITVGGVPAGYEYSINGTTYQASNIFNVTTAGFYTVYIRQTGVNQNPCIFTVPNIQIRQRNFAVVQDVTQPLCYGEKGRIKVAVNDANAQYYYKVTSDGNVLYNIGPVAASEYTFDNLATNKNYVVEVSTDDGCKDTKYIYIGQVWNEYKATVALVEPLTSCSSGKIKITTEGGNSPYSYFINSDTVFQSSNEYIVTAPGTYVIKIVDKNNCTLTRTIVVADNVKPTYTISNTNSVCYNDNSEIRVNVTNANGYSMSYSINNGGTYQTNPVFSNLQPGTYNVIVRYGISYTPEFGQPTIKYCSDPAVQKIIAGPTSAVTASGGVAALAGCTLSQQGGKLRINNAQGGTLPYQYSFDGGATWQNTSEKDVMPGSYILKIKDAVGCEYTIPYTVTLDQKPAEPTIKVEDPVFNCNGTATSTVTVTNGTSANYSYEYFRDGIPNTPITNNVFLNVPSGSHTISVKYTVTTVSTYSNLLQEDFGKGGYTTTPGINPAYCFEDESTPHPVGYPCGAFNDYQINDGKYAVASSIKTNFGNSWIFAKDHTVPQHPLGRFLCVNVGGSAGIGGILYSKPIKDVIDNQSVIISLWAENLIVKTSTSHADPKLTIQLVNNLNNVGGTEEIVATTDTTNPWVVPKSEKWEYKELTLNPKAGKTNLSFVIRSYSNEFNGNDVLIDDIWVRQIPESCLATKDFPVVVGTDKAFTAAVTGFKDLTCAGSDNGEITISAENFKLPYGFDYSLDNGVTWVNSKVSPVTAKGLTNKNYSIQVRYDASATSCILPLSHEVKAPTALTVTAEVSKQPTCTDGASIKATAVGGTPNYQYELRGSDGTTVIVPFQSVNVFTNVAAGSYTVVARDANSCASPASVRVDINAPVAPTATLAATSDLCYDTVNQSTLVVTATGTGALTYSLDGQPAQASNTFTNVGVGTHTIIVTDSNNCKATISNIVIAPELKGTATISKTLDCTTATPNASITVDIVGGAADFTYKVRKSAGTFGTSIPVIGTSFTYSADTADTYYFEITDSKGCVTIVSAIISPIVNPTVKATPVNATCNGASTGSVQLVGSGGSGGYTYLFYNNTVVPAPTAFIPQSNYTGLAAGTYAYQVMDSKGCKSVLATVTITQPTTLTATASATKFTCNASNVKQSATVTIAVPTSGTSPYQYSFDGGVTFTNTRILTVTDNGTNQTISYVVSDAQGCKTGVQTITINKLDSPTNITFSAAAVTCTATTTTVTATAVNGVPTITYSITSPAASVTSNTTGVFAGLAAGTYNFRATDANGCYFDKPYTIDAVTPISIIGNKDNDVLCKGGSTGKVTFTVSGNATIGAYTQTLTAGTGTLVKSGNTLTLSNVPAGTYTVQVRDNATGCLNSATVIVGEPTNALTFTATSTKINCNNDNAEITVTATGGTPNDTYAVVTAGATAPTTFASGNVLLVDTNSGANANWDVYVKDANGCITTNSIRIDTDVLPTVTATNNNQCSGAATTFTITANGTGIAPLSYSIDGTSFQTSNIFNVPAGTYTVTVKDGNGCTAVAATSLTIFPQLIALASVTKELDCSPTPNATIIVAVSGGKAPFTYTVAKGSGAASTPSAPFSTASFTYPVTLANADSYTFVVTDANGCSYTTTTTVNTITSPTVTDTHINPTCNGGSNGSVQLTGAGGAGGFTYSNDDITYSQKSLFTGLAAGNYTFYVKDAKGCTGTVSVTLTAPTQLAATVTEVPFACNASNGKVAGTVTINATALTGTSPYEYSFNGGGFGTTNTFTLNDNGADQPYTYSVRDAQGCTISGSGTLLKLNPPTDLTFTAAPVTCTATTTTVNLTAVNGVGILQYETIAPSPVIIVKQISNSFANLAPGTYLFKVTDANGCFYTEAHTINPVTPITLIGSKISDVLCNGGSTGSAKYTVAGYATTYSYTVNGGTPVTAQTSATINLTNQPAGTYTVIVTDEATGCTATASIIINQPAVLSATYTTINGNCSVATASVTVNATGGSPVYRYSFVQNNAAIGTYTNSNTASLDPAVNTDWDVHIIDANGCTFKLDIAITKDVVPTVTASATGQCFGVGTYTITATPGTGLVAPVMYSIDNGASYQTGNTFVITTPGSYTVRIRDGNGCTADSNVVIVNNPLALTAVLDKDITCSTPTAAQITLTTTGGGGPFNYTSSPATGTFAGSVFTTNTPGSYTFTVTDAKGCTVTTTTPIVVNPTVNPEITNLSTTALLCNGDSNGSILITIDNTKGLAPFVYKVFNNTTGVDYGQQTSGLTAGNYTVTVTDAKGCFATQNISIAQPTKIIVNRTITPITCNTTSGISLGSITINNVSGGTPNYTYHVTGVNGYDEKFTAQTGSTAVFEVVDFGLYQIIITDANGCTNVEQDILVASPPSDLDITVTAPPADCSAPGSATVAIGAGSVGIGAGPFHFAVYTGPGMTYTGPTALPWYDEFPAGSKKAVIPGLLPGVKYTFIVHDAGTGCYYYETATQPIPTSSTLKVTNLVEQNITCKGAKDGKVSFTINSTYPIATDVTYEVFNSLSLAPVVPAVTGSATIAANGTFDVNNLGPLPYGTYFVFIKEVGGSTHAGCSIATSEFNITESAIAFSVTASVSKNANCNPNSGIITAIGHDGTAPYTYQLLLATDPAPTATSTLWAAANTFNRNAGNYTVYAKDAYGCIKDFDITLNKDVDPTIIAPALICYAGTPFTFTITGTVDPAIIGAASYSVNNSAFQASPTFTFNAAGIYNLVIKDGNGCTATVPYEVKPQLFLTAKLTRELDCTTTPDAQITLTATGGYNTAYTYEYSTDGGNTYITMPTNVHTTTVLGDYIFRVKDAKLPIACEATTTFKLDPVQPTVFTTVQTNVSCNGGADGTITVNVTSGVGPYQYQLGAGVFQTSNVFTGLAAGTTYVVTVRDSKSCLYPGSAITITQPSGLTAGSVLTTPLTCAAGNAPTKALVTVNGSGGTPPYLYSFDGTNYSTTNTYESFTGGSFNVLVKDAKGCIYTFVNGVNIPVLNPPTITNITGTPIYCAPAANTTSTVTITTTNGTGSLSYAILAPSTSTSNITGASSGVFSGLADGTYLFEVTDDNGCKDQESYIVKPVTNITVAGQLVSNVICNGGATGAVKFTVANYTGTYSATVSPGTGTVTQTGNTVNVTGLVPGTYTVQILDGITGCTATTSVDVTQPTPVVLNLISNKNANCNFGAQVTVRATGGTPGYKYAFGIDGFTPVIGDYDTAENAVLNPLVSTNWDFYAMDANGCTTKLDVVIASDALPTIGTSTVPYCYTGGPVAITITGTYVGTPMYSIGNGYQSSPDFVLNAPGNYTFYIKDGNGCIVSRPYTLNQQLLLKATLTQDYTCAGDASINIVATQGTLTYNTFDVSFNGGTFTPVALPLPYTTNIPGVYTFRVTDSQGCQATSVSVEVTARTTPSASSIQNNVSCTGGTDGSIVVTAVNGLAPYKYSINGAPFVDTNIFTNLAAGTYDIVVKDAKECESVLIKATVTEPVALAATAVLTQGLTCTTGNAPQAATVTINVTTGTGTSPYQYSFNGGITYGTTNTYVTSASGTVTAYVKDANNCVIAAPVDVIIPALDPPTIDTVTGTPIWCSPTANTTSTVTLNVSHGVGSLAYEITSPASAITNTSGATSGVFNSLPAGTYIFKVTDDNGCTDEATYTVDPLVKITIDGQLVNDVVCNGESNGSVKFNVDNFAGTYTAALIAGPTTGTLTQTGKVVTLTNLPVGTYTVQVTDGITNCQTTTSVIVGQPDALALTETGNINANCKKGAEVTVLANGGTPDYKYAFVLGTGTPAAGAYTNINTAVLDPAQGTNWRAYVIDAKNCETFIPIVIDTDPLPTFNTTIDSQCAVDGKYTFTVNTTGGMTPFQYNIGNGFQTDNKFTVTASGTYNVTVKDANECEVTVPAAVNILPALQMEATITALPNCTVTNSGSISATATGGSGTANYRYTLDGGVIETTTPAIFNNVTPGNRTISVKDVVTNCEFILKVFVSEATEITKFALVGTDVTCNGGNNGTITASLEPSSDGINDNPVYTYSLTGTSVISGPLTRVAQTSPVFENLEAGDYTITVTSGRGCVDSEDVRILQPDVIAVPVPVIVQYGCNTGTNASNYATVTVGTVTGGSKVYTYEFFRDGVSVQKGTEKVYIESDFLGGDYSVSVTDSNGCTGASAGTIRVNPFIKLDVINVAKVAITCISNEEITITVGTTGGTPILLNYNVKGTDNAYDQTKTNGNFTGLTIGSYIITVTNPATGCSIQKAHYVSNPNTFEIKVNPIVTEVCFGTNNGSVELTFVDNQTDPSNDAGPFDYTITSTSLPIPISATAGNAGPIPISGLIAGTYTVTAKLRATPECTVSTVFTIAQPSVQLEAKVLSSPITCTSTNYDDGEISASAVGGWDNNYQYELVLNGTVLVPYRTDGNFTGLKAGSYTVNAKDGKGCVDDKTVTLVIPDPIQVNATPNAAMLSCFGGRDGIITVNTTTGGQGSNYLYTLNYLSSTPVIVSGPQSDRVFTSLPAGTYSITVSDGYNCSVTSANIVITQPTEIIADLTTASTQTCDTETVLTLSATGGNAPYTYSADGVTYSTASFTSSVPIQVPVGKYQYFVKDANNCVASISNEIKIDTLEPLTLDLDTTNAVVKCTGEQTGVIVAVANGALGNYAYTLETTTGVILQGPKADGRFEGLVAGNYNVRVVSGDCDTVVKPVEIKEPALGLSTTHVATNVSCFGENNGKIVMSYTGGTGLVKYAISPDLNQFDTKNTFEKLTAGIYTIVTQDENGCYVVDEIEITQPKPLIVTELANSMIPEVCKDDKDGAFSIEVRGGTAPYSVSLDNKNGTYTQGAIDQTIFDFTNLSGGVHTVYVNDAQGCSFEFVENMALPVVLDPTVEISYDCVNNAQSNMVTITIDKSNIDFTQIDYALDNDAGPFQAGNIFTNVAPGRHFIIARHTNGCKVPTISFDIKAYDPLTLAESAGQAEMNIISVTAAGGSPAYEYSFNGEPFTSSNKYKIYKSGDYVVVVRDQNGCTATITVPATYIDVCLDNYFTPNGDGVYDNWGPGCTNIYDNLEFSIFDRYGRVIAKYHYGQKWDGRYNGAELPSGDYWYVLKLNDEKDAREFVGHFTLYR